MAESQFEKKIWGEVAHVWASDQAAMSYLRVKMGAWCSKHFHRERANSFTVLSGEIVIDEWGQDGKPDNVYRLRSGQSHTVPSGVLHRFRVLKSGEVVEIYWPDRGGTVRLDDIERLDEGGADV